MQDFLNQLKANCKGSWYISFYRLGIDKMFKALSEVSMQYRNLIIWQKNNKNLSNSDYQAIYEPIFYGFQEDYIPVFYGWNEVHEYR